MIWVMSVLLLLARASAMRCDQPKESDITRSNRNMAIGQAAGIAASVACQIDAKAKDVPCRGTNCSVKIETEADWPHLAGSVFWIRKSPYRTSHGRKNWFLDVAYCQAAETTVFDPEQIQFVPIRSCGKGGQNVNKISCDLSTAR